MSNRCICPDEDIDKVWQWSDCSKKGHEEGCYMVHCIACGYESLDCEEVHHE